MERDEALELLRAHHAFPGRFDFRVVVRPPDASSVVSAVAASLNADGSVIEVSERASRTGRYVSLKIGVHVPSAEVVLDVYAVLREVEGVVASL